MKFNFENDTSFAAITEDTTKWSSCDFSSGVVFRAAKENLVPH